MTYENIDISFAYGILSLLALLSLVIYLFLFKNRWTKEGVAGFSSVLLINIGYFVLAVSKTLPMALLGNRLAYGASILLMSSMLRIGCSICGIKVSKKIMMIALIENVLIFVLTASGGSSITLYYTSVVLGKLGNASCLIKEYGPLHFLYFYHTLACFLILIVLTFKALKDKTIPDRTTPVLLTITVFINVSVWVLEKLTSSRFEFLSISYLLSELLLMVIYKNKEAYETLLKEKEVKPKAITRTIEDVIEQWNIEYSLTERETEILRLLLNNLRRVEIAETLNITEHTVKKHTTHIYEKINVTSRNELLFKFNEEIIQ